VYARIIDAAEQECQEQQGDEKLDSARCGGTDILEGSIGMVYGVNEGDKRPLSKYHKSQMINEKRGVTADQGCQA